MKGMMDIDEVILMNLGIIDWFEGEKLGSEGRFELYLYIIYPSMVSHVEIQRKEDTITGGQEMEGDDVEAVELDNG
jgi:hypothetical protein